jgi:diguanylate cyclase (GGDEF)-like protein
MSNIKNQNEKNWKDDQEIENELRNFLSDRILVNEKFLNKINNCVDKFGDDIYTSLLYMLCHLNFDSTAAKHHWNNVIKLHDSMSQRLAEPYPIDIRLALVNYFLHKEDIIKHPTLVDLVFFEKMQNSVYKDELTSLFNYRYLKEHLEQELQRAKRYSSMISVMVFDIDDFKYYNDHHGHEAGNQVLKCFAKILKENIRSIDTAIRYGGEEFILTLPATHKKGALNVYERIRNELSKAKIDYAGGQPLDMITASAGVAIYPADTLDANELIQYADNAMYIAKNNGKNRVQIYGHNRRSHQRIHTHLKGIYSLGLPDKQHPLTTLDISEGGLSIITNETVPINALLDIKINLHDEGRAIPFPARVIRANENDNGDYTIGLRIVEMLTQDRIQLQNFIQEYSDRNRT